MYITIHFCDIPSCYLNYYIRPPGFHLGSHSPPLEVVCQYAQIAHYDNFVCRPLLDEFSK